MQLSFDLLESWIARNHESGSWFNERGSSVFRELALFQDYHGLPEFKKVIFFFYQENIYACCMYVVDDITLILI